MKKIIAMLENTVDMLFLISLAGVGILANAFLVKCIVKLACAG